MKKIIALLAFALVTALVGCGGGGGSSINQNIVKYNGLKESDDFKNDETCKAIRDGLDKMQTEFANNQLTGNEKKEILSDYISESFKNSTKADSSKTDLLSIMGSRFERYIVNEWGFKVTDYSPKNDEKATEIEMLCSIRLNLTKKEGADGTVNTWDSAVIGRKFTWVKEKVNGEWKWRIKSGFPYDRKTDF